MSAYRFILKAGVSFIILFAVSATVRANDDASTQSAEVASLVRDLHSDRFAVRDRASSRLIELGPAAISAIEKATKDVNDAEARKRIEAVLEELRSGYASRPLPRKVEIPRNLPVEEHGGAVTESQGWTADRLHRVTKSIVINPGQTISIQPGAHVVIAASADFTVEEGGELRAIGTRDWPIVFSAENALEGGEGHWGRLHCQGTVELQHATISGSGGVRCPENGKIKARKIAIVHTKGDALVIEESESTFSEIDILEATGAGVVCTERGELDRLSVSGVSVGIHYTGSTSGVVSNSRISHTRETGIIIEDSSYPTLSKVAVYSCPQGVVYSGSSYGLAEGLGVARCDKFGILVEQRSYPSIGSCKIAEVNGVGLTIADESHPYLDSARLAIEHCKQGSIRLLDTSYIKAWDHRPENPNRPGRPPALMK